MQGGIIPIRGKLRTMTGLIQNIQTSAQYWKRGPEIWKDVIAADETLHWNGRPKQGLRPTLITILVIIWTCISPVLWWYALVWLGESNQQRDVTHWLVVAIFSCIGLAFIVLPIAIVAIDVWLRHLLYYAVTDRRVLILDAQGGPPFHVTGYPLSGDMKLRLTGGRYPSIWFDDMVDAHGMSAEISYDSRRPKAFRLLQDGKDVRDLIRKLAAGINLKG